MRIHKLRRRALTFDSLERREVLSTASHPLITPGHAKHVETPTVTHKVTVPLVGAGQLFVLTNDPVPGQGYSNNSANLAGRASKIQVFTGQVTGALNTFGSFTSTGTLTLQNGDVLAVAIFGATKKNQGKPLQFTGPFFVAGYAGVYDGAQGSGTFVGHFNPKLNTAYYTLKGTITLVVPGAARV